MIRTAADALEPVRNVILFCITATSDTKCAEIHGLLDCTTTTEIVSLSQFFEQSFLCHAHKCE